MAALSRVLAWEVPWTEEPAGLQSLGSQCTGRSSVTDTFTLRVIWFKMTVVSKVAKPPIAVPPAHSQTPQLGRVTDGFPIPNPENDTHHFYRQHSGRK